MEGRILLVEDDRLLGAQVVEHLREAGFETLWWTEGKSLTPPIASGIRLLILDLMLPGEYGMDILKGLRAFSEVPVLVLSARNDSFDKVRALKLGADDYLTKPFWPEELVERVRARLRRPTMQREGALEAGPVRVDPEHRTAKAGGKSVELTRVEFDILAALVRRANAVVTRRWLVENVLDPDRDGTERTLDVHVSRIRKKLGQENLIETVWGLGYRLRVPRAEP
ncbi:response regulator transcription factor [Pendulispora albinea]|uniref:Response regulator transcription factor n=1 Tax=Pendulispora albinea TaxID=2741071 RepID=A0ABZ2LY03_9BACT